MPITECKHVESPLGELQTDFSTEQAAPSVALLPFDNSLVKSQTDRSQQVIFTRNLVPSPCKDISRSVSKELTRSESCESRELTSPSLSIKQTKKPVPSVQKTYFSKLVSLQKQPDQKPLIKRTPSDTDRGRREAGKQKRKSKNLDSEDPSYVKVKNPGQLREEAKSWLEGELNRIIQKEQGENVSLTEETSKKHKAKQVTFKYSDQRAKQLVEISGNFTNRLKVALIKDEEQGAWSISLAVLPGTHTFHYLVDGVAYTDPDLPTKIDSEGNVENTIEVTSVEDEEQGLDAVSPGTSRPLSHPTAARIKAPPRRPPSTRFLRKKMEEEELSLSGEEGNAIVAKMEIHLSPEAGLVVDVSHSRGASPAVLQCADLSMGLPLGPQGSVATPAAASTNQSCLQQKAQIEGKAVSERKARSGENQAAQRKQEKQGTDETSKVVTATAEPGNDRGHEALAEVEQKAGASSSDADMGNTKSTPRGDQHYSMLS